MNTAPPIPVPVTTAPATGNPTHGRHQGFAHSLHHLYQQLATRPSLEPGPQVDVLFGRLVELVADAGPTLAAEILEDPIVQAIQPRLQELCARGETYLEAAWSDRIASAARPATELDRFPYLDNYRQLTRMEWHAAAGVSDTLPERIAFIGSGPLPLSALLLAGDHPVTVDCLDRDPGAVERGERLAGALGVGSLRFTRADAEACPDLSGHDVVVLAALVGLTPEDKGRLLAGIGERLRPGALLLVRSAQAARSLLYPALDLGALGGLELLTVLHPYHQVINSVVVTRRPD